MKIDKNKITFEYEVSADTYWLLCEHGDPKDKESGIWWLAQKIDRSEKGKGPDVAVPDVQLTKEEVDEIHKVFGLDRMWENY